MNDNGLGVILEDMNGKMDVVVEAVGQLQDQVKNLPTGDEFNELKDDVKTIKNVVTSQSHQLDGHEERIGQLEAA